MDVSENNHKTERGFPMREGLFAVTRANMLLSGKIEKLKPPPGFLEDPNYAYTVVGTIESCTSSGAFWWYHIKSPLDIVATFRTEEEARSYIEDGRELRFDEWEQSLRNKQAEEEKKAKAAINFAVGAWVLAVNGNVGVVTGVSDCYAAIEFGDSGGRALRFYSRLIDGNTPGSKGFNVIATFETKQEAMAVALQYRPRAIKRGVAISVATPFATIEKSDDVVLHTV